MTVSRRDLFRAGAALGALAAVGKVVSLPSLAEAAVSARTTLNQTYGPGAAGALGYRPIVAMAGEPRMVRTELGVAADPGRAARRQALLSFVQLSDVHVVDHQSPGRLEWLDRIETTGLFPSSYRPHDMLTAHVADAMVQAVNAQAVGPVTGMPFLNSVVGRVPLWCTGTTAQLYSTSKFTSAPSSSMEPGLTMPWRRNRFVPSSARLATTSSAFR